MRPDELPALPSEEGVSLRDVLEKAAGALAAVGLVFLLTQAIGWLGWLALPPLLWLHWRRSPEPSHQGPWPQAESETQWLEDAYASRQRGTGISTLAVRYDVDADWLETELSSRPGGGDR